MRYYFQLALIPLFLLSVAGIAEAAFFGPFNPNPIPEPSTYALLVIGIGGMFLMHYLQKRKRKNKK